jgi:hypothetical protein
VFVVPGVNLEILFEEGLLPAEVGGFGFRDEKFLFVGFDNFEEVLNFFCLAVAFCGVVKSFIFGALSPRWCAGFFYLLLEFFKFCVRIVSSFVKIHELGESFFKVLYFKVAGFELFFELDIFFVVPHESLFAWAVENIDQFFT